MGGESLFVAQTRITTRWFAGRELAFALGINTAVALSGSVLNDYLTPLVGANRGVPFAVAHGTFACMFSLACALGKPTDAVLTNS